MMIAHDDAEIGHGVMVIRQRLRNMGFSAEQVAWLEREEWGSRTTAHDVETSLGSSFWPGGEG